MTGEAVRNQAHGVSNSFPFCRVAALLHAIRQIEQVQQENHSANDSNEYTLLAVEQPRKQVAKQFENRNWQFAMN